MLRALALLLFASSASAQTTADLLDAARTFPAMPREAIDLLQGGFVPPNQFTFGSGTPYNDLEYTAFDTDYMEGETNGFDTFLPVDPSDPFPGENTVKLVRGVNNLDLEAAYAGPVGDRIILGTADVPVPFFLRGADGLDNDFAVIQNVDYNAPMLQLRGAPEDYALLYATEADGVETEGHYLFHTASGGEPDLVAFIWPCDEIGLPVSGTPPRNGRILCNASGRLSLTDGVTVRYAQPFQSTPTVSNGLAQVGTSGREIVGGVTTDVEGRVYLFGASDGSVGGTLNAENTVFVAQVLPNGSRGWTTELPVTNGTLLFDAVADGTYLYTAGRTLGALPGFTNAGRWDAILLKLRLDTGEIVDLHQYGTAALDGYGNVVLDGEGGLYVSGAGSAAGEPSTDPDYLVAKLSAQTLDVQWVVTQAPEANGPVFVSEAWGGLSVAPASGGRPARLLAGGWYMSAGGSSAFLSVYEGIDGDAPVRVAATSINSPGSQADWVLDNVIGADGRLYAAGFTTGSLNGTHRGEGDAWIGVWEPDLTAARFVQLGTDASDLFRKLELGNDGDLYASGYTYGSEAATNADPSAMTGDAWVVRFSNEIQPLASAQFGTAGEDRAFAAYRDGTLYVGGMTEAALVGENQGSFDAYVLPLRGDDLSVGVATSRENTPEDVMSLTAVPNPAFGAASVVLHLEAPESTARVSVFDALGRVVAPLHDGPLAAGEHRLQTGQLAPGVYLVRGPGTASARLTIVR